MYLKFKFEIDKRALTYLKDKSMYNRNYWKVSWSQMGDAFGYCAGDILFMRYDEFSETADFSIGYFEGDNFVPLFTWLEENPPFMPY